MTSTRREFLETAGAGALAVGLARPAPASDPAGVSKGKGYDVAVIGAGVFGAWTAYMLARKGRRVALVDAYGPGNARASSGGFTRVIRMGYGDQEIYTRWAMRSLELWKTTFETVTRPPVFHGSGVLWMARSEDPLTTKTLATLRKLKVRHERLERPELERRWPQIDFGPITWAIFEPESGFLSAFEGVQAVVDIARAEGVEYRQDFVIPPEGKGRMTSVATRSGRAIEADVFVFACGPWLPKVFPDVLGDRIFPTRQEVFFFGPPKGDVRFESPAMPVWVDFGEEIYGLPDFEGRGFKVAPDRHGAAFDPDTGSRVITPETLARVREFVGRRFPALKDAPVVLSEVCQYENTSNGDFLVDRHPGRENVWLVGGGSGHGFKHGPAMGEYVTARIVEGGPVEKRFRLESKERIQSRQVF
ncbi:MAG TPA: FAD-dependent oxidoreductase [Thermoanaerobaculia bacterium]|nr:FAD-dependent oxidoreductase [Thermoanaerobaculia bacterium]